jgi:hypothetical protein
MRGSIVIFILALGLATLPAPAADDAALLDRLIAQLGSPKYAEREQAGQELDAIGPPALDALRRACRSDDAEVRRRAGALVRRIEKRVSTAQLLAPHRLQLTYQDTPVEEAVADLAKKTGFLIKLEGNRAALADRRVTLDTGETTSWEALDQFCRKAGLVETAPASPAEKPRPRNGVVSGSVIVIGGNRPVVPKDVMNLDSDDRPAVLALTAGSPRAVPTHYAGALRLQAIAPGKELSDQKKGPGEALLALEVAAEPTLRWDQVIGLRIDRAVDDQGQLLPQLPTSFTKPAAPAPRNTGTITVNGVTLSPDSPAAEGYKQAPVRLKRGEKPAQSLKELSGTLTGLVRSPVEPLVTVEDVLRSAGKTFPGARAGAVKMLSVKQEDSGRVHLVFQVETPPRKIDDASAPPAPNMTVMINGRLIGQPDEEPLGAANFALLDAQGRPFKAVKATNTGRQSGAAQELEFLYEPTAGQGEPSQFIYRGRWAAIVEVPFRFRDVPLP